MYSITKDVYSHLLDNAVTATFKKPAPPQVRDLIEFEEDMIDLIHKIRFHHVKTIFMLQTKKTSFLAVVIAAVLFSFYLRTLCIHRSCQF